MTERPLCISVTLLLHGRRVPTWAIRAALEREEERKAAGLPCPDPLRRRRASRADKNTTQEGA